MDPNVPDNPDVQEAPVEGDIKDISVVPAGGEDRSSPSGSSEPVTPAQTQKRTPSKRAYPTSRRSGDSFNEDSADSSGTTLSPRHAQEKDPEFIRKLISWVQRSPILYDHTHRSNRNAEKKIEAWNFIRVKLEYLGDAQDLADFWKLMRDRYTKAKRKSLNGRLTKFKFLKELKFLDPHISDRSSWYEKSMTGQNLRIVRSATVHDTSFYIELINFVMDHPCFYDPNDEHYRRYRTKVDYWNELIQKLDFDGTHRDIYKQWKKLRDRYVREMRKLRLAGRPKESCKWELFDAMDWMEPYIEEPRPFEDFEVVISSEEEREPSPKPIFLDGEKKAVIRLLKPVIKKPRVEVQPDPNDSDSGSSLDGQPIARSPVSMLPNRSSVIPTSSSEYYTPVPSTSSSYASIPQATVIPSSSVRLQEEPPTLARNDTRPSQMTSLRVQEEVIISRNTQLRNNPGPSQATMIPSSSIRLQEDRRMTTIIRNGPGPSQATIIPSSSIRLQEEFPIPGNTLLRNGPSASSLIGQKVILNCPPPNEGTLIFGVSKHANLKVLPNHVRVAVQAQGEEAFSDGKEYIFLKS
uniref:MADF domain-containing protein n=1 Tax=Panagrellus redivivus TaxID=6233 RepID=A0A7E5A234_PANRE